MVRIGGEKHGELDLAAGAIASALERFGCGQPHVLIQKSTVVRYERGAIIAPSDLAHLHLILDGTIQIMHYAASGRSVLVHEYKAGHPFGGCDVLGEVHMPVQAIANSAVTVLRFRGWSILDAAPADPGFGLILLEKSLLIISCLARRLVELTVERARDRVRLELVRQARQNMLDEHTGLVEYPPTHSNLAARVGSHREEVTREMSYLKQRGLIERTGTTLLVRVAALEDLYHRERA